MRRGRSERVMLGEADGGMLSWLDEGRSGARGRGDEGPSSSAWWGWSLDGDRGAEEACCDRPRVRGRSVGKGRDGGSWLEEAAVVVRLPDDRLSRGLVDGGEGELRRARFAGGEEEPLSLSGDGELDWKKALLMGKMGELAVRCSSEPLGWG